MLGCRAKMLLPEISGVLYQGPENAGFQGEEIID